jgi:hypothetical protein
VNRKSRFGKRKALASSWVERKFRPGFRGYPIATIAFYGPDDKLATKVVVSAFLRESSEPDFLERWFSKGDIDVREDLDIGEQILAFLKPHAPRSTVITEGIIGCPHEEGLDYPEGASCPQCPFWAGRDRFTHDRIQ